MKKTASLFLLFFSLLLSVSAQNLNELSARDAVTGSDKNLGAIAGGKGIVLIFHSLKCPFSKMYEGRLKSLKASFQNQGINFALVNPEVGTSDAEQTTLRSHVDQSGLNMPYFIDAGQAWAKTFGITKIPEVVVLIKGQNGLEVGYRGAIDNNAQSETAVSEKHLERAINQLLRGEAATPEQVRAVGCNLRTY